MTSVSFQSLRTLRCGRLCLFPSSNYINIPFTLEPLSLCSCMAATVQPSTGGWSYFCTCPVIRNTRSRGLGSAGWEEWTCLLYCSELQNAMDREGGGKKTGSLGAQLIPCSDLCPFKIKVHCGLRTGPEDGLCWTSSFVRTVKMSFSIYTQFPRLFPSYRALLLWHERFSMHRGNTAFQKLQILYLMISGTGQAMQGFWNRRLLLIPSLLHLELYDLESITGNFCASVYPFAFIKRCGEECVQKNFSHSTSSIVCHSEWIWDHVWDREKYG